MRSFWLSFLTISAVLCVAILAYVLNIGIFTLHDTGKGSLVRMNQITGHADLLVPKSTALEIIPSMAVSVSSVHSNLFVVSNNDCSYKSFPALTNTIIVQGTSVVFTITTAWRNGNLLYRMGLSPYPPGMIDLCLDQMNYVVVSFTDALGFEVTQDTAFFSGMTRMVDEKNSVQALLYSGKVKLIRDDFQTIEGWTVTSHVKR
jgi:hypothetical protein